MKGCDGKSLAICDFELRFLSPKPLLSAGFLAIKLGLSTRKLLAIAIVRFWCARVCCDWVWEEAAKTVKCYTPPLLGI